MFPTSNLEINQQETFKQGKSFLFDFEQGDFVLKDGRLVITEEPLTGWIDKILRTEKFRFKIYDGYGVKLEDLFGGIFDKSFLENELEREIRESLINHPLIMNITNIVLQYEGHKAIVSFDVITDNIIFNQELIVSV